MATQTVTMTVLGMHCSSCVKRVERALSAVKGVRAVKVDLAANQALVEVDSDKATAAQLGDAVRKIGFQVPA
jgi:copper ion binding protein